MKHDNEPTTACDVCENMTQREELNTVDESDVFGVHQTYEVCDDCHVSDELSAPGFFRNRKNDRERELTLGYERSSANESN